MSTFEFNEKHLSQIPALQVLINLGYQYLAPAEAMSARGGKVGNVLLEVILREQLKKLGRIQHKGGSYLFSEEYIQSSIQGLKNVKCDGLLKTNEAVYDLLTLRVALEQSIEGDLKSFTLNYVDWRHPSNNVFDVTAEFVVERTLSVLCRRGEVGKRVHVLFESWNRQEEANLVARPLALRHLRPGQPNRALRARGGKLLSVKVFP